MSTAIEKLQNAMQTAQEKRPKVGGFPVLAEYLKQAGAIRNNWQLPSGQSTFWTADGTVVFQNSPIVTGALDVPDFDEAELVRVLRADQAGETSFPEFLMGAWKAGCIGYDVNFEARTVSYYGVAGEVYVENYPAVTLD